MIAVLTNCECGTLINSSVDSVGQETHRVTCPDCQAVIELSSPAEAGMLSACLRCGTEELYQQKDFPQRIGMIITVLATVLATYAWYKYSAFWTFAVLFTFGFIDLLLFRFCRNVLICYRCETQHRGDINWPDHQYFELGIHEKYRQEKLRKQQLRAQGQKPITVPPASDSQS